MAGCGHNARPGERACPACPLGGLVICLHCTRTDWHKLCYDCTVTSSGADRVQRHSARCWRARKAEDAAFADVMWRRGACRCPTPT